MLSQRPSRQRELHYTVEGSADAYSSENVESSVTPTSSATDSSAASGSSSVNRAPSTISIPDSTETQTTTDANGKALTVTAVVHNNTTAALSQDDGTSGGFFNNKGAIAGVFVVLGLVVTSIVITIILMMYRRKRRQRLDRDVARAAASRSHRDDDEKSTGQRSTFNDGPYGGDLNEAPQPTLGTFAFDDPSGGYDSYAMNIPQLGGGDRMSTVTNAGMAGFGAQAAQAAYTTNMHVDAAYDYAASGEGYEELDSPTDRRRSTGSRTGYNAVTTDSQTPATGYYFDPKQAQEYYEDPEELQHPTMHRRTGSVGSVARDMGQDRGLTVTNV